MLLNDIRVTRVTGGKHGPQLASFTVNWWLRGGPLSYLPLRKGLASKPSFR